MIQKGLFSVICIWETHIQEIFSHLRKSYFRIKGVGEGSISIKNNLL